MSLQKKFTFSLRLRNRKKRSGGDLSQAYFLLAFYFTLQLVLGSNFSDNSDVKQVPVQVEVPLSLPEFLHRRGVDLDAAESDVAESNHGEAQAKPIFEVLKTKAQVSESEGNETEAEGPNNGTALHKDPLRVEEILRQIFGADMEDEDDEDEEEEYFGHVRIRDDTDPMLMDESRAETAEAAPSANRTERLFPLTRISRSETSRRRDRDQTGNRPDRDRPSSNKRNKNGQVQRQGQGQGRPKKGKGKGVDLTKYNAYMDAVLSRMNTLIRKKRMDPLRVNLYAGPSKAGKGNKGNANKKNGKKKPNKGRDGSSSRSNLEDGQSPVLAQEFNEQAAAENEEESQLGDANDFSVRDVTLDRDVGLERRIRALQSNATEPKSVDEQIPEEPTEVADKVSATDPDSKNEEGRKTGNKKRKLSGTNKTPDAVAFVKNTKAGVGPKKKVTKESSDSDSESQSAESESAERPAPVPHKKNNNNKNKNSPRPTRGILNGLSTLRRDGNVNVMKDGERARIVRAKFLLGPVALEILPKKSKNKGVSREQQSAANPSKPTPSAAATATAPQLRGILEIRLSPRSPTRIRKLRVFPPGNVQVDGENQKNSGISSAGPGYRKVTPMATARLRQAAVQVVRQVDGRLRPRT